MRTGLEVLIWSVVWLRPVLQTSWAGALAGVFCHRILSLYWVRRKAHTQFDLAAFMFASIIRFPAKLYTGLSKETWAIR